ncbi:efflux RND transporter periplasmic adaptor subunit [Phytohabitans aurantiacus]|uniref:efflux RND transporter periplasmic adaptor subunit n=1 Tax=Phytohabitans aurantiacus TaxID=3016789 RepID=UPI002493B1DB|nr:efflux RND transporter periplasmic adaptor subunit [Phytohabitans aurantiacus]
MGMRGRRWVVAGVAVAAAVGLTSAGAYALTGGEPAAAPTTSTVKVDRGEVATAVATTGTLEPAQTRSLSFAAAGTVTEVKVRAGDQVTSGQVLATIDAANAQEKVDDATESLDEAQSALDEAESTQVCTVAPSRSPSPSPSRSPAPSASATCARSSGRDTILSAEQRVISAKKALAEAKEQLAGTKITAPIAGKVLSVSGSVGSEVRGGSAFVTLADVAGMQISASFPEADAARLATGLTGTVTLADRPGEEFPAKLVQVDPVGTTEDGGTMVKYGVVLAFEKVPSDLLVGQSANVKVTTSSVANVLRVPSGAVRDDGTVLVRTATGDQSKAVELGIRGDQYTEVTSGLIEGDEIVIGAS